MWIYYFQVDSIKELFYRGGFGLPDPPSPARLFGLHLLFIQDIDIDELEGANFAIEHPHPRSHRRLTNDINDISALQRKTSGAFLECISSALQKCFI